MKRTIIIHGKHYTISIREKFAPKERVVKNKKIYSRKDKHKVLNDE